jgi:hypothetical protein
MQAIKMVVKPHQERISPAEAPLELGTGVEGGGGALDFFDAMELGAFV